NCQDMIRGCEYKNVCDNRSICFTEKTRQVADLACRAACAQLPNIRDPITGKNPRGECESTCGTITETFLEPVHNAACDGFIAWDQQHGGRACTIASNIDKASCDVSKNVAKSACDIQQEIGRFYQHNPIAVLESELKPNVAIDGTVNKAAVSNDLGV